MIAFLLAFAVAAANAAPPVRLALIQDEPTRTTLQMAHPLERVLREAGQDASLLGVVNAPVYFGGDNYQFRVPPGPGAPDTSETSTASVLEGEAEVVFVFPATPDLADALAAAAADPKTFRTADALNLLAGEADFAATTGPYGETMLALRADLERPTTGRVRSGMAAYYHLRWKGRDTAVAIIGRTFGGLGRLGAAARAERAKGEFTGLAQGGTFGSIRSDARGRDVLDALEKAGLMVASVSSSEIEHWPELLAYRAERPDGVRWLSANLVYSTAPAKTVLPPYAVLTATGTRIAVVGLTPNWAARLLKANGLGHLKILDPLSALEPLIPRLRAEADVVVVLNDLPSKDIVRLTGLARGLDLIVGEVSAYMSRTAPPSSVVEQEGRPDYDNPFPPQVSYHPALNVIEVSRRPHGVLADWRIAYSATSLDDTITPAEGFPEGSFAAHEIVNSTAPPLLPDAREVFSSRAGGFPVYEAREFWTMAAGLLSERAEAEAGILLSQHLGLRVVGAIRESHVRDWVGASDPPVLVSIKGDRLKALINEAAEQARRDPAADLIGDRPAFVVGGVDDKKRVRGAQIDPSGIYLIATTRAAADALGLPEPRVPMPGTPDAGPAVIEELRVRAGRTPSSDYGDWMNGMPLSEPGLWRLNFRDVGLNLRQTKVVRSDEFNAVPNSRIQGFDELLVGGVFKADAEYLKREFKWTNTVEAEYAKSRIEPRNAPATVNLASNRVMLLTLGTHRAGQIRREWLARSWGPSLGLQYDGEFEAALGLKRKQAYSLFPGVEFFDGTFVRTLTLSGILKRDLGREPPNTQSGLRLRSVFSREIGPSKALLQGELWNNYFFLTKRDAAGDLRLEGDFNVKLRIPIRRHLTLAPFFDFYWFQLKTRPDKGYSMTMGVSIGFSRLWKPQYEDF